MGYTFGTRWSDEKIEKEINNVMNCLDIERMPSSAEIERVTHNTGLISAIRRYGGIKKWSEKLNLPIKESETKLGKDYEEFMMNKLVIQGWEVERMGVKHPYDLLVNDNIKIDVKVSRRYYLSDKSYCYTFNLVKKNPTCDIYTCLALDDNYWIDKLLIIPSKFVKQTQLSIGAKSMYDKYIEQWHYLTEYDEFYKKLA